MKDLNAGPASTYMDSLQDERQRSAVIAIHERWLEHTSSLGRLERLEPEAPLDYLVLYRAAAETFACWPPPPAANGTVLDGRVINCERAVQRLQAVPDGEARAAATAFAQQVIALSTVSEEPQDLDYFVALFLKMVEDPRVIPNIVSGAISRHSDLIAADPDYW